jgi:pilus assembly protein TadC
MYTKRMQDAETILVIILSVTLTIFLIVGIVLVVSLVRLTKTLNSVAEKAQEVVSNVESASEVLKKAAGPVAVGKFIMNISDLFKKKKG